MFAFARGPFLFLFFLFFTSPFQILGSVHKSSREILPLAAHANVPVVKPRGNYLIPAAAVAVQPGPRAACAGLQAVLQGTIKNDGLPGKRQETSEGVVASRRLTQLRTDAHFEERQAFTMTSYYESRVAVVIDAIFYAVLQRTAALELWRGKGAKFDQNLRSAPRETEP